MAIVATPMPWTKSQWFDNNGVVAAGYQLQTFSAGTLVTAVTFSDSTTSTPNANPIILDSSGRANVFLTPGVAYKFILTTPGDSFPAASPTTTEDNILATPIAASGSTIPATFGASVTPGTPVYESDGSNGKTAGLWYVTDSTNAYSSVQPALVGFSLSTAGINGTGSVLVSGEVTGLSGLTAGTLYYIGVTGALTATAPSNPRPILFADSITTGQTGVTPLSALSQNFLASGTWTASINAGRLPKTVAVTAWGGGGGGGGGAGGIGTGVVGQGGGGGGGGALSYRVFNYADITSPVTVTVGAGGTAGSGGASGSAHAGTDGGAGQPSSFGTYLITAKSGLGKGGATVATAQAGGPGAGIGGDGSSVTATGGAPGGGASGGNPGNPPTADGGGAAGGTTAAGGYAYYGGGAGGPAVAAGTIGQAGGTSLYGGGGGGGGGGVTTGNVASAGGAGGTTGTVLLSGPTLSGGGGAGGAIATGGTVGPVGSSTSGGSGGGGGGSQTAGAAGAGANGGQPGGGAGGGGGANIAASGVGGNGGVGGAGQVNVVAYY